MKMFVFDIGYYHYAVPIEKAAETLILLNSLRKVERRGRYDDPYTYVEPQSPPVTNMALEDVTEPEPPPPEPEPLAITHQPLALE